MFLPLLLAVDVTLAWDPSPDPPPITYQLNVATQSMLAGAPPLQTIPTATDTFFTVSGLDYGTTYFFTAQAVNGNTGVVSPYSNEVSYLPLPTPSPTPLPTPTPTPTPTPLPTPTPAPTAFPSPTYRLWSSNSTPGVTDTGPDNEVELGVRFYSDVPGRILAIRFFKALTNSGVHTASLWDGNGNRLGTALFPTESVSGWQQANLDTPIPIAAGTIYVASYHTFTGHYSMNLGYFTSARNRNMLHAPAGQNGVFLYGSPGFPSETYQSSNYWVDIVFAPN